MFSIVLLSLVAGVALGQFDPNCTTYNELLCQSDAIIYCFTDGTAAIGSCNATDRICNDGDVLSSGTDCLPNTTPENLGVPSSVNFTVVIATLLGAWVLTRLRQI